MHPAAGLGFSLPAPFLEFGFARIVGIMFGLGFGELVIVGIVAILLFGKNLPEVARSFGKKYAGLRKQLNELQATFNVHEILDVNAPYTPPNRAAKNYADYDDHDEASAPKFEPPPEAK